MAWAVKPAWHTYRILLPLLKLERTNPLTSGSQAHESLDTESKTVSVSAGTDAYVNTVFWTKRTSLTRISRGVSDLRETRPLV